MSGSYATAREAVVALFLTPSFAYIVATCMAFFFVIAVYGFLILGVARLLSSWREKVERILSALHWVTFGVAIVPVFVYVLGSGWSLSVQAAPLFCAVLVSSGFFAGLLSRLRLTAFPGLLLGHAVLVGLCCPLVLLAHQGHWGRGDVCFQDAAFTVIQQGHRYHSQGNPLKVADERGSMDLNLCERVVGFDHYIGTIAFDEPGMRAAGQVPWGRVVSFIYNPFTGEGKLELPASAKPITFSLVSASQPPEGYTE